MISHTGAGILLKTKEEKYLLVQEAKAPNKWGFPKGHVETIDTTSLDTAMRELQEETGLLPHSYNIVRGPFQILTGSDFYWFYEAVLCPGQEGTVAVQDPTETAAIQWVSKEDLIHPPFWLHPNKYLDAWSRHNHAPVCLIDESQ
jgi:8-oxo-dGTP pyrophosphatase MutT (NUDIX family)